MLEFFKDPKTFLSGAQISFRRFLSKIGHLLWKNGTLCLIRSIVHRIVLLAFGTNLDPIMLPIPHLPLAKVSDRNLFRANQNNSDSFRYLYPSQCESFRTNPKPSFQSESIRGWNDSDWFRLKTWFRIGSDSFR